MEAPSRTNFAVAESVTRYAGCASRWMFRPVAGYFLQQNSSVFIDHGFPMCNQLFVAFFCCCYFSPCLYCGKSLISQTENDSPIRKQWGCLLQKQMTFLQIAAQREFFSRIAREWCVPWCRTNSRQRTESGFCLFSLFFFFFFKQCASHGLLEMLLRSLSYEFMLVDDRTHFVLWISSSSFYDKIVFKPNAAK